MMKKYGAPSVKKAFAILSAISSSKDGMGVSDLAKKLAARLAPAENKPVRIMVTGQNSEKTLQVILDALAAYRGRRLPHLQFLYLGEPGYAPRIESVIRELGGSFHFQPFAS